jgi:hypothetical protein
MPSSPLDPNADEEEEFRKMMEAQQQKGGYLPVKEVEHENAKDRDDSWDSGPSCAASNLQSLTNLSSSLDSSTPIFSFFLSRLFFGVAIGARAVSTINKFGGIVLSIAAIDSIVLHHGVLRHGVDNSCQGLRALQGLGAGQEVL